MPTAKQAAASRANSVARGHAQRAPQPAADPPQPQQSKATCAKLVSFRQNLKFQPPDARRLPARLPNHTPPQAPRKPGQTLRSLPRLRWKQNNRQICDRCNLRPPPNPVPATVCKSRIWALDGSRLWRPKSRAEPIPLLLWPGPSANVSRLLPAGMYARPSQHVHVPDTRRCAGHGIGRGGDCEPAVRRGGSEPCGVQRLSSYGGEYEASCSASYGGPLFVCPANSRISADASLLRLSGG